MTTSSSSRAKILLGVGILFALAYIAGEFIDNSTLRLATKPVPVLLMALYLVMRADKGRFQWLIILGLLLGAVGDIFLELSSDMFLYGLGAFLIGHILYTLAFLSDCRRPAWGVAIFSYLFGLVVYTFLEMGDMGAMALPVMLYIVVITTMFWRAAARFHAPGVNHTSGQASLLGALFFVASDSLLAVTLFVYGFPFASLIIILTYWLGQLGIMLAADSQGKLAATASPSTH